MSSSLIDGVPAAVISEVFRAGGFGLVRLVLLVEDSAVVDCEIEATDGMSEELGALVATFDRSCW